MNIDELLDNPYRAEKTVDVCLRRDLVFRWHELSQKLEELGEAKLADASARELQAEMDRVAEEAKESTVTAKLQDIGDQWWKLIEDNPPRENVRSDLALGANYETFPKAVVAAALVEPEFDKSKLDKFCTAIGSKQFEKLFATAMAVTRGEADIPFSSAVSPTTKGSAPKSRRQSGSASRSNGSAGGSLAKPRSTSTNADD